MAMGYGISLNITKRHTIDLLDKLGPGVVHGGLVGM